MKKFLKACHAAYAQHGIMMRHFTPSTRRSIVRYWMS